MKKVPPKQFAFVPVVCSDQKMAELMTVASALGSSHSRDAATVLHSLKLYREHSTSEFWMFDSGAKLCVAPGGKNFGIYGYHYDGQDIRDAAAELEMLNYLYLAQRKHKQMLGKYRASTSKRHIHYEIRY